jgi:hypothetical protein
MTRNQRHAVSIAMLPLMLVTAEPGRAQSTEEPLPRIAVIEGCGRPLPAFLGNAGDLKAMFDADPASFIRLLADSYAKDVTRLCKGSLKLRNTLTAHVATICFVAAAGVDDPYPYVGGDMLIIETRPGDYSHERFRRDLAKAIERGSIAEPSMECRRTNG